MLAASSGKHPSVSISSPSSSTSFLSSPPRASSSLSSQEGGGITESIPSLKAQLSRMNSDLVRLQAQLESEKRLRTERLRKASERLMELMTSTSLEEGKVEVLKAKLGAEREMREKLEEELDALRAALSTASGASRANGGNASETSRYGPKVASTAGEFHQNNNRQYGCTSPGQSEPNSDSWHSTQHLSDTAQSTFTSSFSRHRQHRREKARDGMSSSPIEASYPTSRETGLEGVAADINNGRRRPRSPLRGVLKRTREVTEEIAGEAGGDRERAFW